MTSPSTSFAFPFFYQYPPYFTLQPVKETRDKQSNLWGQLILSYCKHAKVYVLDVGDEGVLFNNAAINRKLPVEARVAFLDDLVAAGSAQWLDKGKRQCLVWWRKVDEWATVIHGFVKTYGLGDSVMTVDELSSGDDVRGTDLYGLHREILLRALKLLETQGKARLFRGATAEEEGVKFL